jgi:hypothetical protein
LSGEIIASEIVAGMVNTGSSPGKYRSVRNDFGYDVGGTQDKPCICNMIGTCVRSDRGRINPVKKKVVVPAVLIVKPRSVSSTEVFNDERLPYM